MRIVLILLIAVAVIVGIKVASARSRSPVMRFHALFLAFAGLCAGIFAGVISDVWLAVAGCLLLLAGLSYWLERSWSKWLALLGLAIGAAGMLQMLVRDGWDLLPPVVIVCMIVYAWELIRLRLPVTAAPPAEAQTPP